MEGMDGCYENINQDLPKDTSWNFSLGILMAEKICE